MSDRPAGDHRDGHHASHQGPLPVSTLRHDLKTAVNHIRGYSELLIEEAEDHGWNGLIWGLREVVRYGGEAAHLIDEALPTGAGTRTDLPGLCVRLVPLTDSIQDRCARLIREADPSLVAQITEDLNRVATAAIRLGQLLDRHCSLVAGADSGCRQAQQEAENEDPAG